MMTTILQYHQSLRREIRWTTVPYVILSPRVIGGQDLLSDHHVPRRTLVKFLSHSIEKIKESHSEHGYGSSFRISRLPVLEQCPTF